MEPAGQKNGKIRDQGRDIEVAVWKTEKGNGASAVCVYCEGMEKQSGKNKERF